MGCGGSKSTQVAQPESRPSRPSASTREGDLRLPFSAVWDLKEKLGQGQYAVVHRVECKHPRHPRYRQIAAAKVMTKAKLTPEDLAALKVEIEAMKLLRESDKFVQLYEFYDERDTFFIVLELITGGELFDRVVEKEKYSEREAREVIRQLTMGIAFAHSKGVAHRDLKPENILLKDRTDDTTLKIADLGFAKVLSSETMLMTTPCGTPGYVAPEVLTGKPYGLQSDIWSLGVIFYILLCGYPPFAEDDQKRLFEMIKAGRYSFDPAEWSVISDGAKDLVTRILVTDPNKRFKARDILNHPWMLADAAAIPDVALNGTVEQMKRFNARRRLKRAMQGVRGTVRLKLMAAATSRGGTPTAAEPQEVQNVLYHASSRSRMATPPH